MSDRSLVTLGTGAQVPTRERNQNGHLLRWGPEGLLFDPGEGTQRQMLRAGIAASRVSAILVSHFHGDHCLGLPGVVQRISLDRARDEVRVVFPASGREYFERLVAASAFHQTMRVVPVEVPEAGGELEIGGMRVLALPLEHPEPCVGYRVEEPPRPRVNKERASEVGLAGPDVGRLLREGRVEINGRVVEVSEVTEEREGRSFAYVTDTRPCEEAAALAQSVDLLLMEATYAVAEQGLAEQYGHCTSRETALLARRVGAKRLVLTHFSQRYRSVDGLLAEAQQEFERVEVAAELGVVEF